MKKTFVHIYEELDIMHLGKPQGMYPTYMAELGWDSSIVTYDLKKELEPEFRNVKIIKISQLFPFLPNENITKFIKRIPLYFYLYKNAKKIDVLMLYHLTVCSYWNSFFYKLGNPNGKIFIKGDFDFPEFQDEVKWLSKKPKNLREFFRKLKWKNEFKKRLKLIPMVDIYSVETAESFEGLSKFGYAGINVSEKLLHLPNGFDLSFIEKNNIKRKSFEEKENIIFTASRLGTYEKNSEFLLEVLENINLKNWKVVLAGPIEPNFKLKINSFFEKNPLLKDKIVFLDFVKDKNILYSYYNKSKIFVMTSRGEGFANVFLEALYFGNYIITTKVSSAEDVTANNSIGSIIPQNNLNLFCEKLQFAIDNDSFLKEKYNSTLKLSNNFIWKNTITKLNNKILSLEKK